jgi:hypothetical protein
MSSRRSDSVAKNASTASAWRNVTMAGPVSQATGSSPGSRQCAARRIDSKAPRIAVRPGRRHRCERPGRRGICPKIPLAPSFAVGEHGIRRRMGNWPTGCFARSLHRMRSAGRAMPSRLRPSPILPRAAKKNCRLLFRPQHGLKRLCQAACSPSQIRSARGEVARRKHGAR